MKNSRETDLKRLVQFQQHDLDKLYGQMTALEQQIVTIERLVAHNTNVMSAARGLVGMRRGCLPRSIRDKDSSSRRRPKQRCWSKADGSVAHVSDYSTQEPSICIKPIGVVYTSFQKRFEAPRQSFTGATGSAKILFPKDASPENGVLATKLKALRTGMRVWLVYWFDRNSGLWRNFVRPPRAKGGWRVGVFATRSPNRPSPIGLSLAIILHVDIATRAIAVKGVDILDETPLLGLKAYCPGSDAHPQASSGWLDASEGLQPLYYDPMNQSEQVPDIAFSDHALEKVGFLDARSAADIRFMVEETLKRQAASYSETTESNCCTGRSVLAVGSFRITYELLEHAKKVVVIDVVSGMRAKVCEAEATSDPEVRVHIDFQRTFPK